MAGTITDLKPQKRNKDRINVYLDGNYSFGLSRDLAVTLRRGMFLSDQEITHLQKEDEFNKAYNRVAKFIDYRPRSKEEVRRRMKRYDVEPDIIERVLEKLVAVDLIDDVEFAQFWVENRETFRPRSRRMLRHELGQKGLPDKIIAQALEQVDEKEGARHLALKHGRHLSLLDWPAFRQKLTGYLARRGYSYEITREAVKEAWQHLSESDDNCHESEDKEWI